ncbi:MAG: hypothetical protein F6J97_09705 [Leptolyngbya sp. SIO4C1]|nr:hypothetical protein [Leptolyngbya sp. SIO4C1]
MADYLTISKQSPSFPPYLEFQALREIGIDHLQQLASDLWTDYNLHDPGITILEVLCYALTDLGYRNNLDIQDLLALDPKDPHSQENNFFTPNEILTCNPVTVLDWRKRLIDIPGVRNAWIEKVTEVGEAMSAEAVDRLLNRENKDHPRLAHPAIYANCTTEQLQFGYPDLPDRLYQRLNPRGLYDVCLDLEPEPYKDACGVVHLSRGKILEAVRAVLCDYRNLCEDFRHIIILGEEEIALCADIELTAAADPEDVLVAIYVAVQAFLAPRATFYTLQEMLARGKTTAEIFAGRPAADLTAPSVSAPYSDCPTRPEEVAHQRSGYPSHGFIDTDELEVLTLPTEIHTSDLYQIIMDVPGVAAIKKLSIINYINGLRQSEGHPWCLKLTDKHRPVLGVDHSTVTFFKGDLPFKADATEVKQRYQEQQAAYIKAQKEPYELDLPVPRGNYYDLADHYSIHHDFPLTYGVGEDGLPKTVSAMRKAQAKQLKGYLIFFDQVLANYLAQLSHVRDLFSWESETDRAPTETQPDRRHTYFTQGLTNVPSGENILKNFYRCPGSGISGTPPIDYTAYLDFIVESPQTYYARRHQFLDHLLARFAETFTDYVLLNYRLRDGHRRSETDIIDDKAQFLKDYPVLGRDRFRAFNYCRCNDVWDSDNVSGFKKRVARPLGIDNFSRRNLSHYRVVLNPGGNQLVLQKASATATETDGTDDIDVTVPSDPSTIRFTSRDLYRTPEATQAARADLRRAALEPGRYRRLAYRHFHHYGWEVLVEGQAIVTFDQFDRNPSQTDAILDDLLETLQLRQVPLLSSMVDQLTAAVSTLGAEDITIEEGAIFLGLTAPATETETEEPASVEAVAALITALKTVVLDTEADEGVINTAFAAPILLVNHQTAAPEAQLYAAVQTSASTADYGEADAQFVVDFPILVTLQPFGTESALTPVSQLEMQVTPLSDTQPAAFATQPINSGTAILMHFSQAESGDWRLQLNLSTGSESSSEEIIPIAPLTVLRERLAIALPSNSAVEAVLSLPRLTLTEDADRFLTFELILPPATLAAHSLAFTSNQRHPSEEIAKETAFQAFNALRDRNRYQAMQVRHEDGTPAVFTYHGYGIIDTDGKLLAESGDRFATAQERDLQLQRWLICLLAHQNSFRVAPATECFFVEIKDRDAEEIWLLGAEGTSNLAAAVTQQTLLIEIGQDRSAYDLTETTADEVTIYSFVLRLGDRVLARHPGTYLAPEKADQLRYGTALERDLWLDALLYYLNQPEHTPFISGEAGTYQATLLDRAGQPLLITYHSYATRNLAEVAYQRLMYLASDPVYYQITNDLEDDNPYGFALTDRRGRTFATHPGSYPTACERDLAIRNIINYVNKELVLQFSEREEGIYLELLDQEESLLLAGDIPYESSAAAEAAGASLLELAREETNYQLLNDGDTDCPHSFALVSGEERIATHPTYYALASERDQALQALISCVIDDDPAYEIDGVEGQFSYSLVDVLAAEVYEEAESEDSPETTETESPETETPETAETTAPVEDSEATPTEPSGPLLLTSVVLYPDADAARQAFNTLVALGTDVANYYRLDDLSIPNPYGFEIRDEMGEIIARHQTAEGDLIGYSTELEREAAIAKILYYLARPEMQVEITNPEGAFFAEIYDDQHQLVCSGQRTLPSPEAAQAEADLIRRLAGMPAPESEAQTDPYQHRTSLGNCPYSFNLVTAAEEAAADDAPATENSTETANPILVAKHPRFYRSEADRDRKIQQLRLSFSENLSDFIATPIVEIDDSPRYSFELPARHFCAFYDCDADQHTRFESGSLLSPPLNPSPEAPNPTLTYATAAEAREQFTAALAVAQNLDHFHERYDNIACAQNAAAQPFSFELREPENGRVVATSGRRYSSRAEMWAVVRGLQQLAQGFFFTTEISGTYCGYYFYLDLPVTEGADPVALRSVNRYPSKTLAWEAARTFADNLRFLNRYLGSGEIEGTSYGFAIADKSGTPIVITAEALDPVETFQVLNELPDQLRVTAIEGDEPGYQFQLVEPLSDTDVRVWLQGITIHPNAATATIQFYQDALGRLFEPDAIAPYDTPSGFSFRIALPNTGPEAPSEVIAIHPYPDTVDEYQFYPTAEARDQAIAQLREFIRTVGMEVQANFVEPPTVGEIFEADDSVLLRATRPAPSPPTAKPDAKKQQTARQYSNTLIELAQNPENIRRIDDEDGTCFFSWELTNGSKYPVLGTPAVQYSSEKEREDAIIALQACLNDEGFHVLEHILLRPQQLLPPPSPCEPLTDTDSRPEPAESTTEETSESTAVDDEATNPPSPTLEKLLPIPLKKKDCEESSDLCLTSYDPYSFWVSVVLPYWPERFRDMNFRRFVERTLRLEAPAHVALKICWVDAYQMHQFDHAYRNWIEQFSLNACEGSACDLPGSLANLIDILTQLENVYPQGTLHDCEESDPDDNPIILDQTALGTAEDA